MEPLDRLPDIIRVQVKNTFLEVEGDSDDSLEMDTGFARASTEPAKAVPRRMTKSKEAPMAAVDEIPAPGLDGLSRMPYFASQGPAAPPLEAPYAPGQPKTWVQDGLRALESDPELSHVFDTIRRGGMDAALRLCLNEDLMRTLSHKMGSVNKRPGGPPFPGMEPGSYLSADPVPTRAPRQGSMPTVAEQSPDYEPRLMCGPAGYPCPPPPDAPPNIAGLRGTGPPERNAAGDPVHVSEAVVQEALSQTIRKAPCSVTVADPSLEDCPLISCSEGFESLTGYSRNEVLGRNCRFLNKGVNMEIGQRQALWLAVHHGTEFVGVLPNRRKNGEPFSNLLKLTTMHLRGKKYIIGVQADVTNMPINLANQAHMEELRNLAKKILPNNLEAYIHMQAREFFMRQPPTNPQHALGEGLRGAPDFQEHGQALKPSKTASKPSRQSKLRDPLAPQAIVGGDQFARAISGASEQSTSAPSADGTESAEGGTVASQMKAPLKEGGLKSVGSAGHPDTCHSECIFYFFRNGCIAGADCRFCHEFHWRKNMKKNRRILKRLAAQPDAVEATGRATLEA